MKKILVVDDEPEILSSVREVLKDQFQVLTAENGEAALDVVRQNKPDLILTDVLMPKVSGYNFYKNIKNQNLDIPVIVMSGRPSMVEFFDDWSIVSFLNKPFKAEELIAGIDKALAKQKLVAAKEPSSKPQVPPPALSTGPVPARKQKLAVICSVDEDTVKILKRYFEFKNFAIEVAANENEIVNFAIYHRPYIIVCQFWEDSKVFDAVRVYRKLCERQDTMQILFVPICVSGLSAEAEKHFSTDDFVAFDTPRELREKIEFYLN